ncbi:hypothetical protein C484_18687 [Natrialba taiwanensis DSM 12281]|uniref:Uncharacterized protein n=1 Tax=Natrialba taiwanensis DSM 12281 TaxID=1230458 RepID=L9ZIF6_9EURY|nr:hypothetical protein C484_18687 [Natrialba taiwanensis DSM 12281]
MSCLPLLFALVFEEIEQLKFGIRIRIGFWFRCGFGLGGRLRLWLSVWLFVVGTLVSSPEQ